MYDIIYLKVKQTPYPQLIALLKDESRSLRFKENFTNNCLHSVCPPERLDCQDNALNTESLAFLEEEETLTVTLQMHPGCVTQGRSRPCCGVESHLQASPSEVASPSMPSPSLILSDHGSLSYVCTPDTVISHGTSAPAHQGLYRNNGFVSPLGSYSVLTAGMEKLNPSFPWICPLYKCCLTTWASLTETIYSYFEAIHH